MKVTPGEGWGPIVVGAKLDDVEAEFGPAKRGEESATFPAHGIFVGLDDDGVITSVAGQYIDPHDWLFEGELTPFAGEVDGVTPDASPSTIEATWGKPLKVHDSKPWTVLYYDGIYFTFSDGALTSWTIGEDGD